jgi:putative protease
VSDEEVGRVDRYFRKVGVAALELTGDLSIGDRIRFSGATTDFEMDVESMQIDLNPVESAGAGDDVGIKVPERVRPNDSVIRLGSGTAAVSPEMIRYAVIAAAVLAAAYMLTQ